MRSTKNENEEDCNMKFVLDTNIYLHYKLFTERDWKTLLESDDLTLVVPPAVIDELDEKKYSAPDTRMKRRAQEVISKLNEISEGKPVPCGIQVDFSDSSIEEVDWEALRLNSSNYDDRIIAATLALKDKSTGDEVLIVTADFGMKLKAKGHGIKIVSPPDDWKRETKDSRDKEIAGLRNKLQKFQNAMPDVQLLLSTGDELVPILKISKVKLLEGVLTDEDIEIKLDKERKELKSIGAVHPYLKNTMWDIPTSEIKRYDGEVDEYIGKYSRYLSDLKRVQELRLTIEISPVLINKGSSPAEDIDIFLYFPNDWLKFPDDIKLLKETDLREFPKKPTRPTPPQSGYGLLGRLAQFSSLSNLISQPIFPYVNRGPVKQIGPELNNSKMSHYWLRNLKHGMEWHAEPIFVWYITADVITTFQIKYSIHIGNHPEEKEEDLVVVIEDKE